jgi:hypothetical protein
MAATAVSFNVYRAFVRVLSEHFGEEIPTPDISQRIHIYEGQESPVVLAWVYQQGAKVLEEGTEFIRNYCMERFGKTLPIIYVLDYVGPKLRKVLEEDLGVFWMDMSENGFVDLPEVQLDHFGNRNRYASDRMRDNPATPAGAKVLRFMLLNRSMLGVRAVAEHTGVDKGLVSRLAKQLAMHGWVEVRPGKIHVKDSRSILEYWRRKHTIKSVKPPTEFLMGRIENPAVEKISKVLRFENYNYAWTMMPAAVAYDEDVGIFNHYAFYLDKDPDIELADYMELEIGSDRPNVWIILRSRKDTFDNVIELNGINYVDPFRVYLDLAHCPDTNEPTATSYIYQYIKTKIIQR